MKKVFLLLLLVSSSLVINAQTGGPVFKMDQIAIASGNIERMSDFYSNVFGVQFTKSTEGGTTTYKGSLGDIKLYLYPIQSTSPVVNQNRHQFDFVVTNMSTVITNSLKNGGRLRGEVSFSEKQKSAVVIDPDGNIIMFRQILSADAMGKL